MNPSRPRRFTLLDGMILVAATALGLGLNRYFTPGYGWLYSLVEQLVVNFAWERNFFDRATPLLLAYMIFPALAFLLGVLVLRLRQPRPRWRRLVRQPGFVASVALVVGELVALVFSVFRMFLSMADVPRDLELGDWFHAFLDPAAILGGFAVVVAWSMQRIVGHWRPEPNWLDRLGRVVGLGWIALGLASAYVLGGIL